MRVVVELARRRLARGSPGTCPSAPRRGRRTASRCSARSSASDGATARVPVNGGHGAASSNVERLAVRARRGERQQRLALLLRVLRRAGAPGRSRFSASSVAAARRVEQRRRRRRRRATRRARAPSRCAYAGAIRTAVCWRDVVAPPISSGSSSPRRSISRRDVDHLVERRRDQAREPDDVAPSATAVSRIRVGRHHHAEVDHLVVVAAEHDADDVLADVVHVALDGREHDLALARCAAGALLGLHVRLEVGDGALHRARALHDLRQEHPARRRTGRRRPSSRPSAAPRSRRAAARAPARASSVSSSMKSTMPCTSACSSRFADRRLAPGEVELALRRLALHACRRASTSRSVASGRRSKSTSSTRSSSSGWMSS